MIEQFVLGVGRIVGQLDRFDSVASPEHGHTEVERANATLRLHGGELAGTVESVHVRRDHEDVGAGRDLVELGQPTPHP